MIVNRAERFTIKKSDSIWSIVDDYSFRSKNLYNYANYHIRQEFINNRNWLSYFDIWEQVKLSEPYKAMGSDVGCATLRMLDKSWKSFYRGIKDWKSNREKYLGMPKMPGYKEKNGRCLLGISNTKFSIADGFIRFSWKPLKPLNGRFRTHISEGSKLMQCRFVPRGTCYIMEVVYQIEVPDINGNPSRIASIDLGIDNFATITNNIGRQPIVIKGGILKSINQFYNKQRSEPMSDLARKNRKKWSKRLWTIQAKRNNRINTWMHRFSKMVIRYCLDSQIDTLVCGYNAKWKHKSPMRKQTNQSFVLIPHSVFVEQLEYKCENHGIRFILQEESYTSGTSAIDKEIPDAEHYDKSRRKHRGLFISNNGIPINADVNGSYQIMRKVFPNALVEGIEGVACYPVTIRITQRIPT